MMTRLRILVCPMNWGLGHASRSILLVRKLIEDGRFEVLMAADGPAYDLLKSSLPRVPLLYFPSNTIRYHKFFNAGMVLVCALPKILVNIYREHQYFKNIIQEHHIDIVLSDNRYGVFHKKVTSIFLTHQLRIRFPAILSFLEPLGQKINYWFIRKFDFCWIPDIPGPANLAGRLSHPWKLPSNTYYIGPLSRFLIPSKSLPEEKMKYDVIVLLSGPEPQRSILEGKLIRQFDGRKESVLILQGLPGVKANRYRQNNISMVAHMESGHLRAHLVQAKYIICRAGYSSIMDMVALGRTAVLIPTPGQPEQEYLASYLFSKQYFITLPQSKLDLDRAFDWLNTHRHINLDIKEEWIKQAVDQAFKKSTS